MARFLRLPRSLSSFALLMGAHLLMYAGYTAPSNARGKSSSDRSEGQDNDIPLEWLCVGLLSHRRKERLTHWNVNIRLNRIRRTAHLKSLKRISDLYISFLQTLFSFVFRSDFNASNSTTAKKITKLTNQRLLTKFRTNLRHQHGIFGLKRRTNYWKLFGKVTSKLPRMAAERIRVSV